MGSGNFGLGQTHKNNNLSPLHQHINKVLIDTSPVLLNHNINGAAYATNGSLNGYATTSLPHPSSNLMMMNPTLGNGVGGTALTSH